MKNSLLLILILAGFLQSCTTTRFLQSALYEDLKTVGIFKPISIIGRIETGNQARYDSVLSVKAGQQISAQTQEFLGKGVSAKVIELDTAVQNRVDREFLWLLNGVLQGKMRPKKIKAIADTLHVKPALLAIMEQQGIDHGIFTLQRGFTRTKENYRNQNLKGFGVGLLTLGTYIPVPIKSSSMMMSLMVDRKAQKVVFFGFDMQEMNPAGPRSLEEQLCILYLNFLTFKNQATGSCFHH